MYSLDLALSDFLLFRPTKERLCGQRFPSKNTVLAAVKQMLVHIFTSVACRLLLWQKCIANGGDYVENQSSTAENFFY